MSEMGFAVAVTHSYEFFCAQPCQSTEYRRLAAPLPVTRLGKTAACCLLKLRHPAQVCAETDSNELLFETHNVLTQPKYTIAPTGG